MTRHCYPSDSEAIGTVKDCAAAAVLHGGAWARSAWPPPWRCSCCAATRELHAIVDFVGSALSLTPSGGARAWSQGQASR